MPRAGKTSISANYYLLATGEPEKAIQTYEIWARTLPSQQRAFGNLESTTPIWGNTKKEYCLKISASTRGAQLPTRTPVGLYAALDRRNDARAQYDLEAVAHKVNNPFLHGNRYGVAFLDDDGSGMHKQITTRAANQRGRSFSFASDTEAFHGRPQKSA